MNGLAREAASMPRTLLAAPFRRLSREDPWALAAFAATASLGVVVLFNAFPLPWPALLVAAAISPFAPGSWAFRPDAPWRA